MKRPSFLFFGPSFGLSYPVIRDFFAFFCFPRLLRVLVVIPSFLLFYFDQYPVTSSRDGMKRTSMTVVVSIGAVADASIFSIVAAPRRNIGLDDRSGRRNRSKKKNGVLLLCLVLPCLMTLSIYDHDYL